jgi:ferric-dicitrate binding protein FerR (iron transport regulator)
MLNDALKRVLEHELPWNDLRQAGVLRRMQKAAALGRRKRPRRTWSLILVAACAATVLAFVVHRHGLRGPAEVPAALAVSPAAGDMLVRLPDGSTARGADSAEVKVESLRADHAELVQTAGSVRYDVTPDAHRRFVVQVRDVRVSVLGTAFQVDVLPSAVAVRVEHGSVEVVQQDRRVVLASGEGITFDTTGSAAPRAGDRRDEARASDAPSPDTTPGHPPTSAGAPNGTGPAQLLERADRARARGDLDGAARALRELLQRHPGDKRAALAHFMLGRVESAEGAHHDAAQAFAACLSREPTGSLGEDALAELARAHARAGEHDQAVAAAQRYLSSYPTGVHQRAMRELAGAN